MITGGKEGRCLTLSVCGEKEEVRERERGGREGEFVGVRLEVLLHISLSSGLVIRNSSDMGFIEQILEGDS